MESPLPSHPYPKVSKDQILNIFKTSGPVNESLQPLLGIFDEVFSLGKIEPENFQPPMEFNINDVLLEATATPKPLRPVSQKRVYIPKSPFSSSGYADDPTHRVWYYLDEGHNIQGPFTSLEMDFWYDSGFFFNELLIRIMEKNNFVKLIHLFGKTEVVQVYKPALLTPMTPMTPMDHLHIKQLTDQAPKSAEPTSTGLSSDKKQSIYTFGFDADENVSSPLKATDNAQNDDNEASKIKKASYEEAAPKSADISKIRQLNNSNLIERDGRKDSEGKYEEIEAQKASSEPQKHTSDQGKKNVCNGQIKEQYEDKSVLSPAGYKKTQNRPESSNKKHSYVEVYEPKMSPYADKSSIGKQEMKKNKMREQVQTNKQGAVFQYVVKGEKKEEAEPPREKREKNNNKGGNYVKKNHKQDHNEDDQAAASTPGKKGQPMVIFVPKKKEVTYVEKPKTDQKDISEKMYIPKNPVEPHMMAGLRPGSLQRKESDTFEILKATSEYYQTDTTKDSISAQEDSRQSLPPGLQAESYEPVNPVKNLIKKPKEKLRLVSHPYDEYEQAQDRIVAASLGLLDLEEEAVVNKKMPTQSYFKNNSATPSPLIIDNRTVGKLYNFSEDFKYSSFGNQTENFIEKDC